MTMLAVQSLLLIMAAFFFGAMTACFLRRVLFVADNERPNPSGGVRGEQQSTNETVTTTTYTTKTTTVSANETSRFTRALTGHGGAGVAARPAAVADDALIKQEGSAGEAPSPKGRGMAAGPLLPASYATSTSSSDSAKTVAATAAAVVASAAVISATAGAAPANDDGAILSKADPDDLTLIRPITPSIAQRLNADGVSTFSDISTWHALDVAAFNKKFGYVGRIEKENWIEQAAILSKGGTTYFADQQNTDGRSDRFDMWSLPTRSLVRQSIDDTVTADEVAWARDETASVADETPTLIETMSSDDGAHTSDDVVAAGDDARTTDGAALAANAARTIVETTARETVSEDNIEAAPTLTSSENTERNVEHVQTHDLAPQPPASDPMPGDVPVQQSRSEPLSSGADVAGLRSVRSEALVGQDPVRTGDASNVLPLPTAASGMPDDLKRIRGIGVLIEKKLNAMGVRSYQQIANWTAADVARVSETLDFKGRIERESWIEQARILSSGGYTEFSRRSS